MKYTFISLLIATLVLPLTANAATTKQTITKTVKTASTVKAKNPAISITDIQAKLFYDDNGTLSKAITPDMELFNTIIGEGEGGGDSSNTLVDVILANSSKDFKSAKVNVKVTDADHKKVIYNKIHTVNMAGLQYHLPIMLNDTGCSKLLVTANVIGDKTVKKLTIPFYCGE